MSAAALVAIGAAPARAFERQQHLGVGLGPSLLSIDDKSTVSLGGGVGPHYAYGLTDMFDLVVEGGMHRVALKEDAGATTPHTRPTTIYQLGVGARYVFDVLRWVPYVQLTGGAHALTGGTLDRPLVLPSFSLGLGVDYQFTRSFGAGLGLRQHTFLARTSTYPTFTTALLRVEYAWGF